MIITGKQKALLIIKTLWRIPAPFVVPIFLLFAKKIDHMSSHFEQPIVQRYKLPKILSWAETPDEYLGGGGLYEPSQKWIFDHFGRFIADWWWIGVRNVGGGLLWSTAIPIGNPFPVGADLDDENIVEYYQAKALIDRGLTAKDWGIFTLHWELTKDFHGTKLGRKDEDWRTCDYVAKLEISL